MDNLEKVSLYIVHNEKDGKHFIVKSGGITTPEALRVLQVSLDAKVQIDVLPGENRFTHAARHYGWKILKTKHGDFPFIEAMIQLGRNARA